MNKKEFVKVRRCPRCGSFEIYNLDHDQMCLKCDWDNFKYLVDMGQLDNLSRAERAQFMGSRKKGASKKVLNLKTNNEAIAPNKTNKIMEVSHEREAI